MHEYDFIAGGVAIKFLLRRGRPAPPEGHVGIAQQGHPAGDRVAAGGQPAALEVVVPQRRFGNRLDDHLPGGFDVADSCRWTEMIDDAVGPTEAGGGDDLFVINALAAVAGLHAMLDVALARDGAELSVKGHEDSPLVSATASVVILAGAAPDQ